MRKAHRSAMRIDVSLIGMAAPDACQMEAIFSPPTTSCAAQMRTSRILYVFRMTMLLRAQLQCFSRICLVSTRKYVHRRM